MEFFDPILAVLSHRFPIKVQIGSIGVDERFFYADITNRTSNIPVCIRKVRIHFGNKHSSSALHLEPYEEVRLAPKETKQFLLKYNDNVVSRHYLSLSPPDPREDTSGPGFDSPANLFNAIGRGKPKDSWLEIDFNEFNGKIFLKGKIQPMIDSIGCYIRDLRIKKARSGS